MEKQKVKVELEEYSTTCGDGCCHDYGIVTKVNGVELPCHNTDIKTIVEQILQHLGYDVVVENVY